MLSTTHSTLRVFQITLGLLKANMDALAKALVLAVGYIDQRSNLHAEDDDVFALEEIASALADASTAERDAFISAATSLGLPELAGQLGLDSPQ